MAHILADFVCMLSVKDRKGILLATKCLTIGRFLLSFHAILRDWLRELGKKCSQLHYQVSGNLPFLQAVSMDFLSWLT